MKFTEDMLNRYAQPLSKTEEQKCINAISMVVDALKLLGFKESRLRIEPMYTDTHSYYQELNTENNTRKIKIFLQGSYANNTNVRTESDVDIAIVEEDIFQVKYRPNATDADYGFVNASPRIKSFKDEVEETLKLTFANDVERKNKSIKIHGNTYRKDADAVPCRRYKDYSKDLDNNVANYLGGIVITADTGEGIINYPEQHIKNGKEKNVATNYYYKKMVRIIKKMRYLMLENDIDIANQVSSFALESLLWNIPNQIYLNYKNYRYVYMFDKLINHLNDNRLKLPFYKEANGIKSLCPTPDAVDNMNSFIDALSYFYDYE